MGILGGNALQQLVETLLYMFGLHFALWAGVEHKSLRVGGIILSCQYILIMKMGYTICSIPKILQRITLVV